MLEKESRLASCCLIVLVSYLLARIIHEEAERGWCRIADSNRGLLHYECNALPTELIRPSTAAQAMVREDTDICFKPKVSGLQPSQQRIFSGICMHTVTPEVSTAVTL